MKQTNVIAHKYFSYKPDLLSRSFIVDSYHLCAITLFSLNSSCYEKMVRKII